MEIVQNLIKMEIIRTLLLGIELFALEFREQPYRGLYAVAKSKGSLLVLHPFCNIVLCSEFRTKSEHDKKLRKSCKGRIGWCSHLFLITE
jgi:hypothetical protein